MTKTFTATQVCLRSEELHDHSPSWMVQDVDCPPPLISYYAARRVNSMELHLRYARVCHSLSFGNRFDDCRPWLGSSEVRVSSRGVEDCWRVEACFEGELLLHITYLYSFTLFFSRRTPNLATVIPAMDHIDKVLATSSESPYKFLLAVRAALAVGKKAINRYYNKTDHSEVYRIAMGTFS